jgi:hypothetical protein
MGDIIEFGKNKYDISDAGDKQELSDKMAKMNLVSKQMRGAVYKDDAITAELTNLMNMPSSESYQMCVVTRHIDSLGLKPEQRQEMLAKANEMLTINMSDGEVIKKLKEDGNSSNVETPTQTPTQTIDVSKYKDGTRFVQNGKTYEKQGNEIIEIR